MTTKGKKDQKKFKKGFKILATNKYSMKLYAALRNVDCLMQVTGKLAFEVRILKLF